MDNRTVTITFSGPLADAGPLDAAFVFPVVEGFRDALRLMMRHQHALLTGHRPPYSALLSASALRLAAIDVGSYSVALEIAGPMALGELADAPLDGLTALFSNAAADVHALPSEVAFPLRKVVEGLPDGIDAVVIAGPAGRHPLKLTRELFADGPPQWETFRCHGRLQEINWCRGTAVLNSPIDKCLLVFPGTMAERMHEAGNRLVSVAGVGERTPDGVIIIREIESITINDDNGGWTGDIGPFEKDVQQALAIVRWQEMQREWFYDDQLDAWADALLKDALKE
jgi:hypothetical protein